MGLFGPIRELPFFTERGDSLRGANVFPRGHKGDANFFQGLKRGAKFFFQRGGSIFFLCLWRNSLEGDSFSKGGGRNFLGPKGGPVLFCMCKRGDQNFLPHVKSGARKN